MMPSDRDDVTPHAPPSTSGWAALKRARGLIAAAAGMAATAFAASVAARRPDAASNADARSQKGDGGNRNQSQDRHDRQNRQDRQDHHDRHHDHGQRHANNDGQHHDAQSSTPTPTPSGNGGGGGGGGNGGGGNSGGGHDNGAGGLAGRLENSPLVTKARRMAPNNAGHNNANSTVTADTSGGPGTLHATTHNVTVEMGPKGTTIQTGNITFTGPPPATTFPMPGGVPTAKAGGAARATKTPGAGNGSGGATHTPTS